MSWNKTGRTMSGSYMGRPYTGRVVMSRVKYGGTVSHLIELFSPIRISNEDRKMIVVNDDFYRMA